MQLSVPNNLCMKHPRRCNIHTYIDVYSHTELTHSFTKVVLSGN